MTQRKDPPLSLAYSADTGTKPSARSSHLRNWIALIVLAGLYTYVVYLAGGLHLIIAPLVMAPLGYHAFKGKPLIRKVLASTVPWAGSPALAFLGADKVIETMFVHSLLIGLVTVQLWEAMLWLGGYLMSKLRSLV
ncbi:MAG: hypothetical protein M1527_00265 [Gammaproteobacteria bacterium]|nr:hypothetical protein [Gammaproteobacteria bacterium]